MVIGNKRRNWICTCAFTLRRVIKRSSLGTEYDNEDSGSSVHGVEGSWTGIITVTWGCVWWEYVYVIRGLTEAEEGGVIV